MTSDAPPSYEESLEQNRQIRNDSIRSTQQQSRRTRIWEERSIDSTTYSTSSFDEESQCTKLTFAPMPLSVAVICLILNIIIPGLGTLLEAVCLCCFTKNFSPKEKIFGFFTNVFIGLLQMALVPLLCIGWIWSILWGVALIGASNTEYNNQVGIVVEENSNVRRREISTISHNYRTFEGFIFPPPPPKYDDVYPRLPNRTNNVRPSVNSVILLDSRLSRPRSIHNSITPVETAEEGNPITTTRYPRTITEDLNQSSIQRY
ncbi:DgyrCDS4514 [Dimorphilus gyrociliatus]|uniref:DgyrCDS4514 n=1 Tax=Dimorphilus gyrociliatus TaxID=2664684 RepID=A0A7I8VLU7_9ANNE|nr:DgyrCDS4514 [Dimorphilus gyrociliatus]